MATLHIPDELTPMFIDIIKDVLWVESRNEREEQLLMLLEKFIGDNSDSDDTASSLCPFCGEASNTVDRNEYYFWGECMNCSCSGPTATSERAALIAWGDRKNIPGCCPWCSRKNDYYCEERGKKFYVECACEVTGPLADTPEEAERLWLRS